MLALDLRDATLLISALGRTHRKHVFTNGIASAISESYYQGSVKLHLFNFLIVIQALFSDQD